jgi:hypothetical protein
MSIQTGLSNESLRGWSLLIFVMIQTRWAVHLLCGRLCPFEIEHGQVRDSIPNRASCETPIKRYLCPVLHKIIYVMDSDANTVMKHACSCLLISQNLPSKLFFFFFLVHNKNQSLLTDQPIKKKGMVSLFFILMYNSI